MVVVRIAAKNLEKSIRFYKEVLGYKEETLETDAVRLASGGENIRLEETRILEKAYPELKEELSKSPRGVGVTISLHVQDADQAAPKVEAYGGKVIKSVVGNLAGGRTLICRDPDGYILRVHSHVGGHGRPD
jgi:predicted enzyme related to lactoylglutathione lyase